MPPGCLRFLLGFGFKGCLFLLDLGESLALCFLISLPFFLFSRDACTLEGLLRRSLILLTGSSQLLIRLSNYTLSGVVSVVNDRTFERLTLALTLACI